MTSGLCTRPLGGLSYRWRWGSTLLVAVVLSACAQRPRQDGTASSSASASASSAAAAPSATRRRPPVVRVPIGPRLAILPGEGVGPIRFGATVETVERLMGAKCEIRDEKTCRYTAQAVEFRLVDGKVASIMVQRMDRPTGAATDAGLPDTYGMFHGMIPADPEAGRKLPIAFAMHRRAVEEVLGAPKRVEPVTAPNPNGTVERHVYDGVVFEFDVFPGALEPVIGGIELVPRG